MSNKLAISSKIRWFTIAEHGYPGSAIRFQDHVLNNPPRPFLVRGEFSIECAYMIDKSNVFLTSENFQEEVIAWAVIEDF